MSLVRRVTILGDGGAIAWLAALALRRAFQHRDVDVHVVEPDAAPFGVYASLPSLRSFHALAGVEEASFVRATGATFRLGSQLAGWNEHSGSFLHLHSEIGTPIGAAPFYKYALQAHVQGEKVRLPDYALAAWACAQGKFARPKPDPASPFSSYTYGYHIDAARYAEHLRALGAAQGVTRRAGRFADVERETDGAVAALLLEHGARVDGDFFIDASGDESLLTSRIAPECEDWSPLLPCDRVLIADAPAEQRLSPLTRVGAADAGWLWRAALQHRTGVAYAYSSAHASDDQAVQTLTAAFSDAQVSTTRNVAATRRLACWRGNCVAIGGAAVSLAPLASADLHLAQAGISNLIALFPVGEPAAIEAAEYNRLMAEFAFGVRDFTLAHYRAGPGRAGAFWEDVRRAPLPERLRYKLDLFSANGRLEVLDFETFEEIDWVWLLLGRGLWPETLEPQVRLIVQRVTAGYAAALSDSLRRAAETMPAHEKYLEMARLRSSDAPTPRADKP